MPFVPGELARSRELEPHFIDVPPHLQEAILDWIGAHLSDQGTGGSTIDLVMAHMRWSDSDTTPGGRYGRRRGKIIAACRKDASDCLDVVDFLLAHRSDEADANYLERHLRVGHSAYAVRGDGHGLEWRVDPSIRTQVQEAAAEAEGSAGEHLASAWNAAYGRSPDPVKAYSESIKAVEAALARHVSPGNEKQTLGTMVRDIETKPSKWGFLLAQDSGVHTVLAMMRVLWTGQTSRHGGIEPTRPETDAEARAAVQIAAALVQFGTTDTFSRNR